MPDQNSPTQKPDSDKSPAELAQLDFESLFGLTPSSKSTIGTDSIDNPPLAPFGAFSPENVAMVVSLLGAAVGVTTVVLKGVEAWLGDRANRKLRVKYKDFEIELSGPLSESDIKRRLAVLDHISESLSKEKLIIEKVE